MEDELHGSDWRKQLSVLEKKAELLEEERREMLEKCSRAETEAKDLRFTGTHTPFEEGRGVIREVICKSLNDLVKFCFERTSISTGNISANSSEQFLFI